MARPAESAGAADVVAHCRALCELSPVATALTASNTHVVQYANPAFYDLIGHSPDAVIGHPLGEVIPSSGGKSLSELLDFALRTGKAVAATLEHSLPGLGTLRLSHTAWPVQGGRRGSSADAPQPLLVEMVESAGGPIERDADEVTIDELLEANQRLVLSGVREQSLAEEAGKRAARLDALLVEHDRIGLALRAERDRAQEYLDLARALLVTVDVTGTVIHINGRGCEVLGYAREDILGAGWFDRFVAPESRSEARAIVAALLADDGDAPERSESAVLHRSGEVRLISWHHAVIRDRAGRVSAVVSSGEDVTAERRSAELRNNFLHLASHELRTPVTALTGCVRLLTRRGGHDVQENQIFEMLEHTSQRMSHLVRTLLDVAELQTGRRPPNKVIVDLGRLALEQVEKARGRAQGHRFVTHRRGSEPLFVSADGTMIGQVLNQLLDNAEKYSPEGSLIDVTVTSRSGDALISVRDRGIGLAQRHQARLGEPFYQVSPMIHPTSGFGLGLYLAGEIVSTHGGRMWVESDLGKGSTFVVSLPLVERGTGESRSA